MSAVAGVGGGGADSRLRGPGFESCAAVLKPWASVFTLHCSIPLSCINEYLAIDKWWICVRAALEKLIWYLIEQVCQGSNV